jgi:DNA-binding CsgD family transcriptional regulator
MTRKLYEDPYILPYELAVTSRNPPHRVMAHALATFTAGVPATRAWMSGVDRRGRVRPAFVLLARGEQPRMPELAAREYHERYWYDDPFSPHRFRDRQRRVVTLADVGGPGALAATSYGREFLAESGFAHRVFVHIWNDGRLLAIASLLRTRSEPEFRAHEVAFLHRVQPLVAVAYGAAHRPPTRLEHEDLLAAGGLRPREAEVARLAAAGCRNAEIAHSLLISPETVKRHLSSVYGKLGVRGRTELTIRLGPAEGGA